MPGRYGPRPIGALGTGAAWSASPRLALVLGNASYGVRDGWSALPNVGQDVLVMRRTLAELGFRILPEDPRRGLDLDRDGLENAVLAMKDALAAGEGFEAALVYYTGHGLEIAGRNCLSKANKNGRK